VFFTVVEQGSMAKAARALGVPQPAVSEVIAGLEHTLETRLLDRHSHGVEPTIYGDALLRCTIAVFDELTQGVRDIAFLSDPAGASCGSAARNRSRPPCFRRSSGASPNSIRASVSTWRRSRSRPLCCCATGRSIVLTRRRSQRLDQEPPEDLARDLLFNDELVLAVGAQSRWARRRRIDLADLVNERWILTAPETWNYEVVGAAFQMRGLPMPDISVKTLSLNLRTSLIAAGDDITALPKSVVRICGDRFALNRTGSSVCWVAYEPGGLKSLQRSDEGRCIQRQG
jgi:DNA-binding transcriptional LysR family regulator